MKIASVKARVLAAETQAPVVFGIGRHSLYTMVLVEVQTEDGIVGYGEAATRRAPKMTARAVEDLLAPAVVGMDARNIEGIWMTAVDQLRRWGHTAGVVMEAVSGLDVALWDVLGKSLGIPTWQALAGAGRQEVECYASSVYIAEIDAMCALSTQLVEAGFRRVKIKVGRSAETGGAREDMKALAAIREAVGPDVELAVDANGAYRAAEALILARQMEDLGIVFFEEPLPPDDVEGYRRLHEMSSVPLARGETDFGVFTIEPLIRDRILDVIQPDLGRCGGITGARQLGALALATSKEISPHTGFSGALSQLAALHVAAATPNLGMLEYMIIDNPLREILVGGYPACVDGVIATPQGPGLGIDLDMDKVTAYTVT